MANDNPDPVLPEGENVVISPKGPLDKLPPWVRHLVIVLFGALLTAGAPVLVDHQQEIQDWIVRDAHIPAVAVPILATLITSGLLALTKLTKQYGNGAGNEQGEAD